MPITYLITPRTRLAQIRPVEHKVTPNDNITLLPIQTIWNTYTYTDTHKHIIYIYNIYI